VSFRNVRSKTLMTKSTAGGSGSLTSDGAERANRRGEGPRAVERFLRRKPRPPARTDALARGVRARTPAILEACQRPAGSAWDIWRKREAQRRTHHAPASRCSAPRSTGLRVREDRRPRVNSEERRR
jgi:hypothetical protein